MKNIIAATLGLAALICPAHAENANPTSTLTRPNNTTAYSINDLIASNTTAGSIVVPTVTVTRFAASGGKITGVCLTTPQTSGLDLVQIRIRFWRTAPTYTNGDNGAYAVATGASGYLGKAEVTLEQFGDGATGCAPIYERSDLRIKLASGSTIGWDMQVLTAFTPSANQTFTMTLDAEED